MRINHKHSIIGSILAFVLASSCCWLPILLLALGSATGLASFSAELEEYSGLFMLIAIGLLLVGGLQYYQNSNTLGAMIQVDLYSNITCPECQHTSTEEMPTNACQYFYECTNCSTFLKPKEGDCCVYCSFGTVPCPPIQQNKPCC